MNFSTFKKHLNIRSIFLICSLFILPIIISYFSFKNIIDENYLSEINKIKNGLIHQNANIKKIHTAEHQINDFLDTLINKNKFLQLPTQYKIRIFEKLDELYPGAFKWLVFDQNGNLDPEVSKEIKYSLYMQKHWTVFLQDLTDRIHFAYDKNDLSASYERDEITKKSFGVLQRAIGKTYKVEHLYSSVKRTIAFEWNGEDCYVACSVLPLDYKGGFPSKIQGGVMLFVFNNNLYPTIWEKRMIMQRKNGADQLAYPAMILNLSDNISEYTDRELPQGTTFALNLIQKYRDRSKNIFQHDDYLCIGFQRAENSDYRIISLANIKDILNIKQKEMYLLNVISICLSIAGFIICMFYDWDKILNVSLKRRIATLFIISIIMPVIVLISITKTFTTHEEMRLRESDFLMMRQNMESLDLRYKDTPRFVEKEIYAKMQEKVGLPDSDSGYTLEHIRDSMFETIKDGVIEDFVITDSNGKIATSSWKKVDKIINYVISLTFKVNNENEEKYEDTSIIEEYMREEADSALKIIHKELDFARPTHLRHFLYVDRNFFLMCSRVKINNKICSIIAMLPERYIEKSFSQNEFTSNKNAREHNLDYNESRAELNFYSTLKPASHFPPDGSPIFKALEPEFLRAHKLSTEEYGEITVASETFLYLIKPLSSMNEKSYIPCYITSTKHIEVRIKYLNIMFLALKIGTILGTILLSLILATSLLEPIKMINDAAQKVGRGDLNVFIRAKGNDEIGRLSHTFNDMVKGLRERQKMQAYVSDSVKEAIKEENYMEKETESIRNGKNIEATILFSDVRNFTGITEKNEPHVVFELLNEFLGGAEPIIRMNHGRVDKYIGDAVMAIFHKTSPEHHAISAIKTAVMIMKFLNKMNKEREEKGLFSIQIGIGISTGTVLLGDVGSSSRKDLTVIGDEVNLASRLETASKQGKHTKIVFSGSTYQHIKDFVDAELMPFNEIRGKEQTVSIYELIRLKI